MANSFANTILRLIKSTNYSDFKSALAILKQGSIDPTIPCSETHVAADLVDDLAKKISLDQVEGLIGLREKIAFLSTIKTSLGIYDRSENPGSQRLFLACQHLEDLSKLPSAIHNVEKGMGFIRSAIDEVSELADNLANSKSMLEATNHARALIAVASNLDAETKIKATEIIKGHSASFIEAVNDPTSSFHQLSEPVAMEIVRGLSLAEVGRVDVPDAGNITRTMVSITGSGAEIATTGLVTIEGDLKIAQPNGEQEADAPVVYKYKSSLPTLLQHVKSLKVGSKEYHAKIKFFTNYISSLPREMVNEAFEDATYLMLAGDEATAILINKLFSIK